MNVHSNLNSNREVLPFKVSKGFTGIPNVIFTHYCFFPGFTGNVVLVYGYLIKLHNDGCGYAFPTQMQAMRELGISDRTFRNCIDLLQEMRLIRVGENPQFGNNVYYLVPPIEDDAEFFATFPQAADVKRKKEETVAKIRPKKEKSKRKMTEKKAEDDLDNLIDWI